MTGIQVNTELDKEEMMKKVVRDKYLKLLFCMGLAFLVSGCSTSNNYRKFLSSGRTFPIDCSVVEFNEGNDIRETFQVIGDYDVLETGLSIGCSEREVYKNIRQRACVEGADAVQYYGIIEPSALFSTCFQARARFLVRKQESTTQSK